MQRKADSVRRHFLTLVSGLCLTWGCVFVPLLSFAVPPGPETAISRTALVRHVQVLAAADMRGRAIGTPGEQLAARYIVENLQRAGLTHPEGWDSPEQVFEWRSTTARNVVFALKGSDPVLRDEWIVLGAHFDHLGEHEGQIYHGADDNASGVAGVMEVAKALLRRSDPNGPKPLRRSILFCFFTGEERGFVGSRYFLDHPPVPVERIIAMINADMISRDDTQTIHVVGVEMGTGLKEAVERANRRIGMNLRYDRPEWLYQSDHYVFFTRNIPFVYFGVDDHPDYHRPTDTADKINPQQLELVSRLIFVVTEILADAPTRPLWKEPGRR